MPTVRSPRFLASASAASMLAEPPLVEIPTATSSGLAWAMSWRAKIASAPMSFAMAVMLAGSAERETAGITPNLDGGSTQSETRSFASVAEPPLPKAMSFPPRSSRPAIAAATSEMTAASDSAAPLQRGRPRGPGVARHRIRRVRRRARPGSPRTNAGAYRRQQDGPSYPRRRQPRPDRLDGQGLLYLSAIRRAAARY